LASRFCCGESERYERGAGGDRYILAAVEFVGHRSGIDGGPGLEMPEVFAGIGIESDKITFQIASEDQMPGRGKIATPRRGKLLLFPPNFSGFRIDGADRAPIFFLCRRHINAAEVRPAGNVRLQMRVENIALLADRNVEQTGLRAVTGRHPVGSASS